MNEIVVMSSRWLSERRVEYEKRVKTCKDRGTQLIYIDDYTRGSGPG